MKYQAILPLLFFLTEPALAAQPASPGECLEMYYKQMDDSAASRLEPEELMHYLANRCMPQAEFGDEVHYFKLLQVMDADETAFTVQASLSVQGLTETIIV